MWTAGGKTFLKFVEHLVRHLLAFPAPNYLSNLQSYGFLKFTSHQVSKIGQNQSMLINPPYVYRQGKFFLTLAICTRGYFFQNLIKLSFIMPDVSPYNGSLKILNNSARGT